MSFPPSGDLPDPGIEGAFARAFFTTSAPLGSPEVLVTPHFHFVLITPHFHFVTICRCSVIHSCPTFCDPMDCRMPGFPVHHLPELAQTRVHLVSVAIQPSHLLSSPSLPAFYLSQYQGLL